MISNEKLHAGKILEENKGLVFSIAGKYTGHGIGFEDLVQYGYLGFMKAINKYDAAKGVKLTTYAYPWIEGEIRHALRNNRLIHVPRRVLRDLARIREAERELQNAGIEPTNEVISELIKMPVERIENTLIGTTRTATLNGTEGETEPIEFVDGGYLTPEQEYENAIIYEALLDMVNHTLFEDEREFVYMRYGFLGRVYTYREIGEYFGKSEEWARLEDNRLLRKFRNEALFNQMLARYEVKL